MQVTTGQHKSLCGVVPDCKSNMNYIRHSGKTRKCTWGLCRSKYGVRTGIQFGAPARLSGWTQVKNGSAWSCIINIWDGSSWGRCSMRTCGVNARRSVGVWTGSKTRIRRQCTVSGNSLNWRVFWYYGGTNLHRQKVRQESFRGFARKEQILTDCRFK